VEYLKPQLADRGFTAKAVYTEDWGYIVDLDNPQFRLWIGCGITMSTQTVSCASLSHRSRQSGAGSGRLRRPLEYTPLRMHWRRRSERILNPQHKMVD